MENYIVMQNYFKNLIDHDELDHKIVVFIEFEIIKWRGKYVITGGCVINPKEPFRYFSDTNSNKVYDTATEAQAAAQKWYAQELIAVIPNLALEENIKPLPFNHGRVELEISLTIIKQQNIYTSVGTVKQCFDFDQSDIILDEFKFDNLGFGSYSTIDYTYCTAYDIFQLVLMNNLALSCNKCKYNIIESDQHSIRICGNKASLFCDCVMDRVDDGCSSFDNEDIKGHYFC